uniref:Uncharacterized protein n=1 Tax=Oryza punctata TaxID=4537 RepID=A0A0E0MEE4_ORYPU
MDPVTRETTVTCGTQIQPSNPRIGGSNVAHLLVFPSTSQALLLPPTIPSIGRLLSRTEAPFVCSKPAQAFKSDVESTKDIKNQENGQINMSNAQTAFFLLLEQASVKKV